MIHLSKIFSILLSALLLTSCITEDVPDNTPRGNFELLWQTLDEHYCFFSYKKRPMGLTGTRCTDGMLRKSMTN